MATSDILLPVESTDSDLPAVRTLSWRDLRRSLEAGWSDFAAMPTHVVFLCAFYPIVGVVLAAAVFKYDLIPLLFPLASGFAIIGPVAAVGLYELSRRKEAQLDTSWSHVFDILKSPSRWPMAALAGLLLVIFTIWLITAQALYQTAFPDAPLTSSAAFFNALFTPAGRFLIISGISIGAVFALVAASLSVISMPMLLDRHVGMATAVATSLRVVAANPLVMLTWFAFVAGALVVGSIPFFMGLAVVLPVLGHATWHLYQRAVEPARGVRPAPSATERPVRYGAQFPISLFAGESRDAGKP